MCAWICKCIDRLQANAVTCVLKNVCGGHRKLFITKKKKTCSLFRTLSAKPKMACDYIWNLLHRFSKTLFSDTPLKNDIRAKTRSESGLAITRTTVTVPPLLLLLKLLLSPQLQTEINARNNCSEVSDGGLVLLNFFLLHSRHQPLAPSFPAFPHHSFRMVG